MLSQWRWIRQWFRPWEWKDLLVQHNVVQAFLGYLWLTRYWLDQGTSSSSISSPIRDVKSKFEAIRRCYVIDLLSIFWLVIQFCCIGFFLIFMFGSDNAWCFQFVIIIWKESPSLCFRGVMRRGTLILYFYSCLYGIELSGEIYINRLIV